MHDQEPQHTSIAELAKRAGKACPCAGNLPVPLDDPDHVWFIAQGSVDLFLVEFRDGVEQASPQHLLRRESGELLPGVAPDCEGNGKGNDAWPAGQGTAGQPSDAPAGIPAPRG